MRRSGTLAPRALLAALVAFAVIAVSDAAPAQGASFIVDATHDAVDASPGDGICADAAGACTLRAAVMETNALLGADEISLPAGSYGLSIAPDAALHNDATGDLDVKDDLAITGATATQTVIDGGGLHRVFAANPGASANNVEISHVTIRNGRTVNSEAGGGIANTGGQLTLSDSIVTGNTAATGGGGIFNRYGVLLLVSVAVSNNTAASGGGLENFETGTVTIETSTITGNSATSGGGIHNQDILTVSNTTVNGNQAETGGGIFNFGSRLPADVHGAATIVGSTISDNLATFAGGGIVNSGPIGIARSAASAASVVTMTITNSTVSGNHAPGAGIFNWSEAALSLINVTVAANATDLGLGSVVNGNSSSLDAKNVIIGPNDSEEDCTGSITSLGHNLDSDGTCGLTGPGDLSGVDPLRGPLADNGGPTQTHALLAGSSAIDAGDDASCPAADQRGVSRPQDGRVPRVL